jgi:S1-C subfamily serine protease
VYNLALKSTTLIGCRNGTGSGFLIDSQQKLIVTAYHVVDTETDVVVMFPEFKSNGKVIADQDYYFTSPLRPNSVRGKVVVSLKSKDLALIQVTHIPTGFVPFNLSTERSVPGEDVYTVGNPGASEGMWIFSGGHVRQVFDNFNIGYPTNNQQIHAAIAQTTNPTNPGDSGGPVINKQGQIVGMTSGGVVDIKVDLVSFAIDVTEIRAMWERFVRQ